MSDDLRAELDACQQKLKEAEAERELLKEALTRAADAFRAMERIIELIATALPPDEPGKRAD